MTDPGHHMAASLGDLVTRSPAAARVLHAHGIDFCCGCPPTLGEACAVVGADPQAVVAALEAALADGPTPIQWDTYSLAEVVEHIEARYHQPMERELPRLVELAVRVEKLHGDHPQCPHGLTEYLEEVTRELLAHQRREEETLFPGVVRGEAAEASVRAMVAEHEDHEDRLGHLRRLTQDLTVPDSTCTVWRTLYEGLALFEQELMEHVHVENHILAPRVLGQVGG